jgi:two-component system, cell cycle sensor histidine kinase PleC
MNAALPAGAATSVIVLGAPGLAREIGRLLNRDVSALVDPADRDRVRPSDVAVLDLDAWGAAGREAVAVWNASSDGERPTVLTLYQDPDDRAAALALGDALRAPADSGELKDRLSALIRAHRLRRESIATSRKLADARALLHGTEDRLSKLEAVTRSGNVGRIVTDLAHELKTPLNAVLGYAELIRDQRFGPIENPRYVRYAVEIHDAASHLARLCEDAMNLAKADSDRVVVGETRIAEVFDRARSMLESLAQSCGVRLKIEVEPGFPVLRTDAAKVLQIVLNLASNAIKFTPSGGRVKVKARMDRTRGAMILVICDTGVGMSEEEIAIARQPFGQVGNRLGGRPSGIGVGLPLTQKLVDGLGGQLEIVSRPGGGTVVTVVLPSQPEKAA